MDEAAIALGGTAGGDGRDGAEQAALFGGLAASFDAGFDSGFGPDASVDGGFGFDASADTGSSFTPSSGDQPGSC